ncbi:ATP-grasp domain-containing protein [Rahnella aquatilis]|nr:ATP-grasp domain-containing protein [Rahnella aquatilis]
MLNRILIANRGEIARRIARTAREMGIEYVAVYSDADTEADHLSGAIRTVNIGGPLAADSYLNIDALVSAARHSGCDAVHPGYGFLSENPEFAEAVSLAGLTFIGPSANIIRDMGNKILARQQMEKAGVPVLPGSQEASESFSVLNALAEEIGYPVILKPVAGGGGKGMQVVEQAAEMQAAVAAAVRIARANFNDGRLMIERYIHSPRHIEVQIMGDKHGQVVHLYERECSLQRRHQKIIEEAPATSISAEVREAMLNAAVNGARQIGYFNAGTFEFIVAPDNRFYFLEVNTRLQVEHPVTEMITGLDLVEWQIKIAAGEQLPLSQSQIVSKGHAFESRIYAEDPDDDFTPSPGPATVTWPETARTDSAFDHHGEVPAFYDPLIAKLIVHAADREQSRLKMVQALTQTWVFGVTTNSGFLLELLNHPRVMAGNLHTGLIDQLLTGRDVSVGPLAAVASAAALLAKQESAGRTSSPWYGLQGNSDRQALDPAAPAGKIYIRYQGNEIAVNLLTLGNTQVLTAIGPETFTITIAPVNHGWGGQCGDVSWQGRERKGIVEVILAGKRYRVDSQLHLEENNRSTGNGVTAPMPGTIVFIAVEPGAFVKEGDTLAIVEAMKMENRVVAVTGGVIAEVLCATGEIVSSGQQLFTLEERPG